MLLYFSIHQINTLLRLTLTTDFCKIDRIITKTDPEIFTPTETAMLKCFEVIPNFLRFFEGLFWRSVIFLHAWSLSLKLSYLSFVLRVIRKSPFKKGLSPNWKITSSPTDHFLLYFSVLTLKNPFFIWISLPSFIIYTAYQLLGMNFFLIKCCRFGNFRFL